MRVLIQPEWRDPLHSVSGGITGRGTPHAERPATSPVCPVGRLAADVRLWVHGNDGRGGRLAGNGPRRDADASKARTHKRGIMVRVL